MSYTPLGPPPPPEPEEPPNTSGRSLRPFLLGAAVGAAVLLAGIGVGFVVWGDDDDAPVTAADTDADGGEEAPADETDESGEEDDPSAGDEADPSDPFGGDLSDMFGEDFSDMFGGDLSDFLPDDFGDFEDMFSDGFELGEIQAILLFEPEASERQMDRIDQAWSDSDLLSSVLRLDADELPSVPGLPDGALPTSVSGFAQEEDAEAVRAFVCSFVDDPGVEAVQLTGPGTRPCDQSL